MTRYIVFEGTEGVYKTTNVKRLVSYLRDKGYKVLETKEPGSEHSPLTMELRKIMLDNKYDKEMSMVGREFISQAIRSIHLKNVIVPAIEEGYDFIIQDRGVLSGLAYGQTCGNNIRDLEKFADMVVSEFDDEVCWRDLYSNTILLKGNSEKGLATAVSSKQEFETGDAMESRGVGFINDVSTNMDTCSKEFTNVSTINVDNKDRDSIFNEIIVALGV